MALQQALLSAFGVWVLLNSRVLAEPTLFYFWATNPDDTEQVPDIPQGQPASNGEFETILKGDAEQESVLSTRIETLGNKGSTYYWGAMIERAVVDEKYRELVIVCYSTLLRKRDCMTDTT